MKLYNILLIFGIIVLSMAYSVNANILTYEIINTKDDGRFSVGTGYSNMLTSEYIDHAERDLYLRFCITVPKNSTIISAVVKVVPRDAANQNNADIEIHLIDNDNCPPFIGTDRYNNTGINISYIIDGNTWQNKIDNTTHLYDFHGLDSLIQTYIERPGYNYNQYIGIHFKHTNNSDYKMMYSSNAGPNYTPILVVEYINGDTILSDVYMADPHIRIKQKLYCQLINIHDGDKLVVTTNNIEQINKTLTQSAIHEEIVIVDYTNFTHGLQTLNISIKNEFNINYQTQIIKNWITVHDGIPAVGINENNALCINGTPFFPITNYLAHPWYIETQFDGIYSAINVSVGEGFHTGGHTIETFKSYLNICEERGNFYAAGPSSGGLSWDGFDSDNPSNSSTDNMTAYIIATKNYPALLAWFWDDEPNLGGEGKMVHADTCREWSDICYASDTEHPVWTNIVTGDIIDAYGDPVISIEEYMYLYNADYFNGTKTQVWDIIETDYYPLEYDNKFAYSSVEHWLSVLDALQTWNYNLIPIACYIESQDIHDNYRSENTEDDIAIYLIVSNFNGTFQSGETVNADSGGTGVIPTIHGDITMFSFVRPEYNTMILENKSGIFEPGTTLTGQTSNAKVTFSSVDTVRPRGYLKGYDWTPGPSPKHLKNLVWLPIIHGMKAISYFDFFCELPVENAQVLNTVNTWIADLDQIILSGDAIINVTCTENGNGRIDHMVKDYNNTLYIFAGRVEKEIGDNPSTEIATFVVPNLTLGTNIIVYGEDRSITSNNGTFTDTFEDYDIHIYKITDEIANNTPDTLFEYYDGATWVEDTPPRMQYFRCYLWCTECANAEQSSTQHSLRITNNGTAAGIPKIRLNQNTPNTIIMYMDDDHTYADAIILNDTYQVVGPELAPGESVYLSSWVDLINPSSWPFETYAIVE